MKSEAFLKKSGFYEKIAWKQNFSVCGIDEVGRGCLAGPLVVAAAILPQNASHSLLKDSKALNRKELIKAYAWIKENCHYSIAIASWKEIDRLNIYQATLRTMKKSVLSLIENPEVQLEKISHVLVDAMPLKLEPEFRHPNLEIKYFPHGESISPSIAAASIVAKVTRDNLMAKMSNIFPALKLETHKGYGTETHRTYLKAQGPTIIHRKSFIKNIKIECQTISQISIWDDYGQE